MVKVTTTWFVLLLGLGVGWWLLFLATEVWLRRTGQPVEVGIADRPALALLAVQVAVGAVVLPFGDGTGLWLFTGLLLLPYLVVGALAVQRLREKRRTTR